MGVRILHHSDRDSTSTRACLYCSTTEWAFGPVFYDSDKLEAWERAELFCQWLDKTYGVDPRRYADAELEAKYSEWLAQEEEQIKTKEEDDKLRYNYGETD